MNLRPVNLCLDYPDVVLMQVFAGGRARPPSARASDVTNHAAGTRPCGATGIFTFPPVCRLATCL